MKVRHLPDHQEPINRRVCLVATNEGQSTNAQIELARSNSLKS